MDALPPQPRPLNLDFAGQSLDDDHLEIEPKLLWKRVGLCGVLQGLVYLLGQVAFKWVPVCRLQLRKSVLTMSVQGDERLDTVCQPVGAPSDALGPHDVDLEELASEHAERVLVVVDGRSAHLVFEALPHQKRNPMQNS